MKDIFKSVWKDPVWSKVIATAIIASVTGVITNWNTVTSLLFGYIPVWSAYFLLLILTFFAISYLYGWIKNSTFERKPKPIYIREDMLAKTMGYNYILNSMLFDYDKNMPLCELIEAIKNNFVEYSLHELVYGTDWELISLNNKVVIDKNKIYKSLSQLGIKAGDFIEVYPKCSKEKIQSFPPHPSLCVHPNHYRAD
ncbi:hypothetical protein [Psychromonas sp. KJ10-2]|uniref:hypothetical protein n=1 Tax=Psychromonas sp. KJ10-2 TaxID=3391822 RepID=UPI0039B37F5B